MKPMDTQAMAWQGHKLARIGHQLANMGWLFAGRILRMALAMAAGIIVARYLGAEGFGMLSYATAFALLARPLATFQLEGICVRELVRTPEKAGEILGSALALSLTSGVVCFLGTWGAILLLRPQDPLTCAMVALAGSGLVFAAFEVFDHHFQAKVHAKPAVAARTLALGGVSLAKILAIPFGPSPMFFAGMTMAEPLVAGLAMAYVFVRHSQEVRRPRLTVNTRRLKALVADAWPLALSGMAAAVYLRIDKVMLGQMLDHQAVGVYAAAARLAEAWYMLPISIMTTLYPAVVRAMDRPGDADKEMMKIYRVMVITGLAAGLATFVLAKPMIVLLLGEEFREAGPILAGYGWSVIFVGLAMAKAAWLKARNLTRIQFATTLAGALVNVGLNLWLIPSHGPMGAVWATLVSYAVEAWLALYCFGPARGQAVLIFRALTLRFSVPGKG